MILKKEEVGDMSHTSGKFSGWLYNKLFGTIVKEQQDAVNQARLEERKWADDKFGRGQTSSIGSSDPFYAKFPEKDTDYKFDKLEYRYLKEGIKGFKRGSKDYYQLVNTIEATGWAPTGFEDAAFRIGSIDELSAIQNACFKKYILDPLGKSIVMNMQYFTVGKGVRVSSVADEVNDWLTEFRSYNKMGKKEKKMVRSAYIEGEYFLLYVKDGDRVYLRKVAPNRIRDIKTKEDDVEQTIGYEVAKMNQTESYYVKDVGFNDNKDKSLLTDKDLPGGKYIQFIRYGEEEYVRGQPPMYCVLRYLRHYEDWIVDRMRLNHERAKVVWIRTRTGTETGKPDSPFLAPKGGIILEETGTMKYRIESAKLESDDAKEDGLAILYSIGAGVQMPLHVLTQITSEAVYSSIKKSDTPFSQMVESNQDMWKEEWDSMYRFGMKLSGKFKDKKFKVPYYPDEARHEAMKLINRMVVDKQPIERIIEETKKVLSRKAGKVINATIEDVPITQIFPDVAHEDPLLVAKALFLHHKMKIVSNQTAAEKAGYNWQEELAKMVAEQDVIPKDEESSEEPGQVPGLSDDEFGDTSLGSPEV
jgi:hypothetical protein